MSQTAIHVENLGKQYRIGQQVGNYRTLRETLSGRFGAKKAPEEHKALLPESIWALEDVSFDVKQGSVFGRGGAQRRGLRALC